MYPRVLEINTHYRYLAMPETNSLQMETIQAHPQIGENWGRYVWGGGG